MRKIFFILSIFASLNSFAATKYVFQEIGKDLVLEQTDLGKVVYLGGYKNGSDKFTYWTEHIVGTGSGSVSVTSMSGMAAGDYIGITAGTYSGGMIFGNLNEVTITNYNGLVVSTATWDLGYSQSSMDSITVSGSGYSGLTQGLKWLGNHTTYGNGGPGYLSGDGIMCTASHYVDLIIENCYFDSLSLYAAGNGTYVGTGIDMGHANVTYTGSSSTMKWIHGGIYNCTMLYCVGSLFQGSYSVVSSADNIVDSIEISGNQYLSPAYPDSCQGNMIVGSIFDFNIHDNYANNTSAYKYKYGDVGWFQIAGNGSFYRNYHHGGYGYSLRLFGTSLGTTKKDSYIYDNIDLATWCYPAFDMNIDSLYYGTGSLFTSCNFHLVYNTCGNKTDDHGSNTVCCTAPYQDGITTVEAMSAGSHGEVRNNFQFNCSDGTMIAFQGGAGTSNVDTSNNYNLQSTAAISGNYLSDTINCLVPSGSFLVGKAYSESYVTTDYAQNSRSGLTVGAREPVSGGSLPPVSNAGSAQTINFNISDSATLNGSASYSPNTGGSIASYSWSQISGPGSILTAASSVGTVAYFTGGVGTYGFALTVTDNLGSTNTSYVTITVANLATSKVLRSPRRFIINITH